MLIVRQVNKQKSTRCGYVSCFRVELLYHVNKNKCRFYGIINLTSLVKLQNLNATPEFVIFQLQKCYCFGMVILFSLILVK